MDAAFSLYRSAELTNRVFNNCFAPLLIPEVKVMSISATAFVLFAVIKYASEMQLGMRIMLIGCAVFYATGLLFLCVVGAYFHDCTKEFQAGYRRWMQELPRGSQKYCIKVLRSCPSFGFRVGSFYAMKKITIVTVFDVLINILLFCLLTY